MNLLLDTNILIYLSKDSNISLTNKIFDTVNDKLFLSVVALGELRSIAFQNKWGAKKWRTLENILSISVIIEINETLVDTYTQIDAYSQRRNPSIQQYPFNTPRNMGKNDLWIAATAALLGLTLITTDADFNHLHDVFINVKNINPDVL